MTFPTNNQSPHDSARQMISLAARMRNAAGTYIAQCDAGAMNINDVCFGLMAMLAESKVSINTLSLIPGVYVQLVEIKPNKWFDAVAAQTDVAGAVSAIDAMIAYIENNAPVDAQRYLQTMKLSNDGSGTLTPRMVTAAGQLAAFRTQLVAFRDAFDA